MTLNELKYIVALARERHFGRAAKACYVSQPTLSVAVKKLEQKLGVTLFERRSGEVRVTLLGKEVIAQAQRVLEEAEVIEKLVKKGSNQLSSPLRIGTVHTVGPCLYPHLVSYMARIAPEMPLAFEEKFAHVLAEELKHGDLDLAIVSMPFSAHGLLTLPVYQEEFVVLLPKDHPLGAQERLALTEVAQENVLLLEEGHCLRDQVLKICPECINRAQSSVSSLEATVYMVASGLGLAIVPRSAAERYSNELVVCKPLDEPQDGRVIALAWRRSFPRTEALNAVHTALEACQIPGVVRI